MANINTRNVHRSNMLLDFPYGKDFVYDEMVADRPGRAGRSQCEKGGGGQQQALRRSRCRSRARGRRRKNARTACYDLLFVAIAPDGRQVRAAVKGDRDPGYGSTSKMISECAICLLRDTPDVAGRHLDSGCGDGRQTDQTAGRPCRLDVRGGEVVQGSRSRMEPSSAQAPLMAQSGTFLIPGLRLRRALPRATDRRSVRSGADA